RAGDDGTGRVAAAFRAAAAAAYRGIGVFGLVVVGAQAGGQHEALAELQRVEQVQRRGGGLAVAVGAGAVGAQAVGVPVRVVQVGGRPVAVDGAGQAPGLLLLAGELQAGAQVVLHAAGGEVGAQVELVGEDGVFLV